MMTPKRKAEISATAEKAEKMLREMKLAGLEWVPSSHVKPILAALTDYRAECERLEKELRDATVCKCGAALGQSCPRCLHLWES